MIKVVNNEVRNYDEFAAPHTYNKEKRVWEDRYDTLATKKNPFIYLTTNNPEDRRARTALARFKGAKLIKSWTRDSCIDDPYGRPYKVGTIQCQVWDCREVLGSDAEFYFELPY